ncbi:MAG TPA: PAS domain S-box protein [Chitinophagaceae bacterium]|jgi:PAS domain S-box-containing protein|nr:PAS domain S-box protein [Chitinophagaceae bacterium]
MNASPVYHHNILNEFFHRSPYPFCITGTDGYLKMVNRAFRDLLGYEEEELMRHSCFYFLHPQDVPQVRNRMQDLQAGGLPKGLVNRYRAAGGKYLTLQWEGTYDPEQQLIYATARPVEEGQPALEREEQWRLRRAKQMARLGSWEFDLVNGRTNWACDELYAIYGITREEHPEITIPFFLSRLHPDDRPMMENLIMTAASRDSLSIEHRLLRTDGTVMHVAQSMHIILENGIPVRMTGIMQDISERRAAEEKLALSEQRFRSLVHNGYDMISIIDAEGIYLYNSEATYRLLNYSEAELLGKNAVSFVHPDDVPAILDGLQRIQAEMFIADLVPFRFRNSRGEWRWLEVTATNMTHTPGVGGIVVNGRDITDKKELQDRLAREIDEQRRRLNKAAIDAQEKERSQLSRELHDNVNQVLTTIKLYTELCLDKEIDNRALLEKSAAYLTDCINEIRSISRRLSTPTLGRISLRDSLRELADSLNLAEKLLIRFDYRGPDTRIEEQTHLGFYRIVQEHLTNVLRHAQAREVVLLLDVSTEGIRIEIRDDGVGFDLRQKRRGIGISNMYGRAESMNAELKLTSSAGKGTRLTLFLPAAQMLRPQKIKRVRLG